MPRRVISRAVGGMMADISNKGLALILLVAMVISVSGTIYTLNKVDGVGSTAGRATTQTGQSNFTINSSVSIYFNTITLIPFGVGTINDSVGYCIIGTNGSPSNVTHYASGCLGFNTTVSERNLTIENDGTVNVNVSLNFTGNASTFITGTTPSMQYHVYNHEVGSCTIKNGSSWREVGGYDTNSTARICNNLSFVTSSDTVGIEMWLRIPQDAVAGNHNVTINAIACADASC